MPRAAHWIALAAITAAGSWALDAIGLPSATIFAALMIGLAFALRVPHHFVLPRQTMLVAQAIVGVVLGSYMQASSLEALADDWLPVALVSLATLLLSLLAGVLMARTTDLDDPTASLGMVAGGASGIIAMADELGADDRIVAFMQYSRVLLIVLTTPLIVVLLFGDHHAVEGVAAVAGQAGGPFAGAPGEWLLTFAIAIGGTLLGRVTRMPVPTLLGPLLLGSALALLLPGGIAVPPLLREIAFALIGLQVGLRFTLATVRRLGRLLIPVLISSISLSVACFGLAVALDAATHVTLLDAWLATTPGGLYAVLAAAVDTGADSTFVVAVQTLRLLVMIAIAPLAVGLLLRHGRRRRVSPP